MTYILALLTVVLIPSKPIVTLAPKGAYFSIQNPLNYTVEVDFDCGGDYELIKVPVLSHFEEQVIIKDSTGKIVLPACVMAGWRRK